MVETRHSRNREPRSLVTDLGVRASRHTARPVRGRRLARTARGSFIMLNMFTSEATTRGVRVQRAVGVCRRRSQPSRNQWFFLYTVTITNEGTETVQLLTRHWIITDGTGQVEEVKGPGVVGKQPTLAPGESFEYTSGCPLSTPFGIMEGTYQMVAEDGDHSTRRSRPFTLSEPYTVH